MAASLQAAATLTTKVGMPARGGNSGLQLRSSQAVSKAFGVDPSAGARLTCSLQSDFKDLAQKCVDATKIAGFALATSALVVSVHLSLSSPSISICEILTIKVARKLLKS